MLRRLFTLLAIAPVVVLGAYLAAAVIVAVANATGSEVRLSAKVWSHSGAAYKLMLQGGQLWWVKDQPGMSQWTEVKGIGVIAIASLLPALWLAYFVTRPLVAEPGICPTCGYDLRATPGRCPECGTTVASKEA